MNCVFCEKEISGNRCLSCGMNQDSFIKPVEIKVEEVITEAIEEVIETPKPKKKKGK